MRRFGCERDCGSFAGMRSFFVPVASCLALIPALALASPPPTEPDPGDDTNLEYADRIFNGTPVQSCAWPTAVAVRNGGSLCTGTLVHPQVVVYAAHCGASSTVVQFGERSSGGGGNEVSCQTARQNPGWSGQASDQGNDWAYCLLPEPIDLPITPIVFGCETSATQAGAEVAIVGFGQTETGGAGQKNWAMTTLTSWNASTNKATLGGGGLPSVCSGDSGGPAFVQFPDGSWHAFGIASTVTGGCGGAGTHALMQGAIPWIEGDLPGLDLTPCHDADGTWNPGAECKGFYAGGDTGYGVWGDWCKGTPFNGASATCSDPYMPDEDPPTVTITNPLDGSRYELADAVDINITAEDGWGIKEVHLEIDGVDIGVTDFTEPYGYAGAMFPGEGVYELVATAEDWTGLIGRSEPVSVGIGMDVPVDPVGTEGTGTEGIDPNMEGEGGCGCSTSSTGGGTGAFLFGVVFLLRRRRRR